MDYDGMLAYLRQHECEVIFTKVNGIERWLRCTLNSTIIRNGDDVVKKLDEDTQRNPGYITAWDLDINEWRRFRVSSVKSFRVIQGD